MTDTVFWSWQNDLPGKSNRHFIRDCLADAVKLVSDQLDIDDSNRTDLELDHDTKGELGAVDIPQTILKKIDTCSVMVADVTPITCSKDGKRVQNPNVMIELGYGMKSIGTERIIPILNTAHGDVDSLPFDIRNRRTILYELTEDATKAKHKTTREKLASILADAIKKNITETYDHKSAAKEIVGVAHDPQKPGLWQADWPVEHLGNQSNNHLIKVEPTRGPRAWLRIIPRWSSEFNEIPHVYKLSSRFDNEERLWSPGCSKSGKCGGFEFGYMFYWTKEPRKSIRSIFSEDDDKNIKLAYKLAAFLEEKREIWISFGEIFYCSHDDDFELLKYDSLLSEWAKELKKAMIGLDKLGALKHRRIIIGIDGLKNVRWNIEEDGKRFIPARSRKPDFLYDETKQKWSNDDQTDFLRKAWCKLQNSFESLNVIAPEKFSEHLRNCLTNPKKKLDPK